VHYNTNTDAANDVVAASSPTAAAPSRHKPNSASPGDVDTLFDALEAGLKEHNGGDVRLDILVNNAGVMAAARRRTSRRTSSTGCSR